MARGKAIGSSRSTGKQELKNPRGNQRKDGRASPNGDHRAFKEPIQLTHRDDEK